jgi:phosphocarrier protein HPr
MTTHTLPITLKLTNKRGLDPKVASELAVVATHFDCDQITLTWQARTVDVRSIVALLSLGVEAGEKIQLHAEGKQAQAALDALIEVIQDES